ncbi:MAG: PAS domain-containing protein, partial [Acidobacteriaceae bacterium]|nr:PAS domain-containing protein [Acidobacteriaceae bacterium]
IFAAACLDYVFAPPHDLRFDTPIARILAFLITSLVVTTITVRLRRAEGALGESNARLEEAQRIAQVGWWQRDLITGRLTCSEEVCRILGVQLNDIPDWPRWLELIHPNDRARAAEAAEACLMPGAPHFNVEYRVIRPDGAQRIIHSQDHISYDHKGRPVRQFGALQDITDLRRAEQAFIASEERFRTLVQFSFDVYWESDAQHRFTRQEFREGLSDAPAPGSEIGKTRWEVPYLEPDEEAWRKHRETLDAHLPFRDFELARPAPDGAKRYVSVSGMPVFDAEKRFIGYRGVGRHTTERKRAEVALRRSQAYLAEAQRLSHTGTAVYNASGTLYWSDECYRIWELDPLQGWPSTDTLMERIHADDRDNVRQGIQRSLREKGEHCIEFRIVGPGGKVKHIEAISHHLMSANGEIDEIVATHVDVTERKCAQGQAERLRQLEADLAHMNRLGMMGELIAWLAHEIIQPIASARNNARAGMRLLEMSPSETSEALDALASVVKDTDRAKEIVARIRDHVKKASPRKERFDINAAITEVIIMAQNALNANRVSVRTSLANSIPLVLGDRVQLQQVILNLLLNAMEAMNSLAGPRQISISTDFNLPNGVVVAVRDSGPGLEPEQLGRVFNAFYTTKPGGIGMGLSICRSIIDAHGGRLWAEANQPLGAVFLIALPAVEDAA